MFSTPPVGPAACRWWRPAEIVDQVAVLPIRSDPSPPTPATLLSLALRLQLPLATRDAELAEAAWAEGWGFWPPEAGP